MELDFSSITLSNAMLCFVTPGQVHRYIGPNNSEGWFIFVDTKLATRQYREIFDTFLHNRQAIVLSKNDSIFTLTAVLETLLIDKDMPLKTVLLHSLTDTITGLIASNIIQSQHSEHAVGSRKYSIVTQFKQLITSNYQAHKQVKEYADLLHITPLYLNEVVKEITGFTAGHWIHQEIMQEAKRLLYHTDLDITAIAYELGYEDHTYFSRFFRKKAGITASAFRNQKP